MFRLIIELYNKYAATALIEGHRVDLGAKLGYLFPARIERNYNVPRCDVVATLSVRKEDSTHPAIFFTDGDYCIIKWQKMQQVRNGNGL